MDCDVNSIIGAQTREPSNLSYTDGRYPSLCQHFGRTTRNHHASLLCANLQKIFQLLQLHYNNYFSWNQPQQQTFGKILKHLSIPPVLKLYNVNEDVNIQIDVSSYAPACFLLQRNLKHLTPGRSPEYAPAIEERTLKWNLCTITLKKKQRKVPNCRYKPLLQYLIKNILVAYGINDNAFACPRIKSDMLALFEERIKGYVVGGEILTRFLCD
uniref:Uncharacterized protein n=1 Tax=Glossina pallidipes TaxID=7398 RepID=A0A1A9ZHK1_GLOPL